MRSGSRAAVCFGLLFAAALFVPQPALGQHQPLVKPGPCAQGYLPVCAVKQKTLVTYVNACTARGVRARIIADRACMEGCPPRYAPVCGTDAGGQRRIFGNACEAEKSAATDIHKGSCRRIALRNSAKGASIGAAAP
jgi:hypothetical protein